MRSKIFKSLLSVLLIMIFVVSGVACNMGNKGGNNGGDIGSSEKGYTFALDQQVEFKGTHNFTINETETDLVKGGKSEYVLVFPEENSSSVASVRADFLILFKKATGVSLPIKIDSDVDADWTTDKKYISVGNTTLVEKADISSEEYSVKKLKTEGVRIITKGNTQFLLAGNDFGIMNAMYVFLEIYFNFDNYHRSAISIDTGVTDIKFKNLDVTDIPDVEHYQGAHNRYGWSKRPEPWDSAALGVDTYVQEVAVSDHRFKSHTAENFLLPVYANFDGKGAYKTIHNCMTLIPKNTTFELPISGETISSDSKMYPDGGGNQLCYTAHGDPVVYENMIKICTEKMIYSLIKFKPDKNPGIWAATITIDDNWDHCSCEECTRQMAQYESSGIMVKFANEVGKRVNEWLQSQKDEDAEYHDAYRERLVMLIYGYHRDVVPPSDKITNADGTVTYVPKKDFDGTPIKFNDYASIWLVNTNSLRHTGMYDTLNGTIEYFPGWSVVCSEAGGQVYWYNSPVVYCRDFAYDELSEYSNDFWETLAYYGYVDVFADHYSMSFEYTGWHNLLVYLNSKLRWNCHADTDALIRKFMKGMYHDAADTMYSLYKEMMGYYVSLRANCDDPSWHVALNSKTNYPYVVLERWINLFEKAIDTVSYLEDTDPDLYLTIKTRIRIEQIGEIIKIKQFYGNDTNRPFSLEKLNEYRSIIAELNELSPNMTYQDKNLSTYVE